MEPPKTSDVGNVRQLPVAVPRQQGDLSEPPAGLLIRPPLWTDQERIRNISAGIREKHGGAVFLTTDQTAEVLHISVRTLSRIPRYKLERFPGEGSAGTLYAACDIAHYYVMRCKEAVQAETAQTSNRSA